MAYSNETVPTLILFSASMIGSYEPSEPCSRAKWAWQRCIPVS